MSSSNSSNPVAGDLPTIPPEVTAAILEAFTQAIRPSIGWVLTATALTSILIPILIALFYFSTPTSRRQPIFILNVLSILFGIALCVWNNYLEV